MRTWKFFVLVFIFGYYHAVNSSFLADHIALTTLYRTGVFLHCFANKVSVPVNDKRYIIPWYIVLVLYILHLQTRIYMGTSHCSCILTIIVLIRFNWSNNSFYLNMLPFQKGGTLTNCLWGPIHFFIHPEFILWMLRTSYFFTVSATEVVINGGAFKFRFCSDSEASWRLQSMLRRCSMFLKCCYCSLSALLILFICCK